MAISEYNYIPTYIKRTIANKPKDVVTANYWNELFNLLIKQGDHTAEELGNILNHFTTVITDTANETAAAITEEHEYASAFEIHLHTTTDPITADKTFAEIRQAIVDKREILLWVSEVQCLKPTCKAFEHTITLVVFDYSPAGPVVRADVYECYDEDEWFIKQNIELAKQNDIGDIRDLTTIHKYNLVAAVNDKQDKLIAGNNITIAADGKTISATGGSSASIAMRVDGGFIQYSTDNGNTWNNLIAEADLKGDKGDTGTQGPQGSKGDKGDPGKDGAPGVYYGTTQPAGDTHPVWIDPDGDHADGGLLPAVTASDNGKVLRVVSGAWAAEDMPTGGSSEEMRVIKTITITTNDVNSIYFNSDDNGHPFALTKRIRIRMYGAATNTGSTQATLFFRAGQTTGDAPQNSYPIKVNSNNKNYIFDFIWDLYSGINCWYGDLADGRAGATNLYRYVPSDSNNSSDITVREIKLAWSIASVFFQNGATIVVEGM